MSVHYHYCRPLLPDSELQVLLDYARSDSILNKGESENEASRPTSYNQNWRIVRHIFKIVRGLTALIAQHQIVAPPLVLPSRSMIQGVFAAFSAQESIE